MKHYAVIIFLFISVFGALAESSQLENSQLESENLIQSTAWLKEYIVAPAALQRITALHILSIAWKDLETNEALISDSKKFVKVQSHFVSLLVKFLDDPNSHVRLEAIYALQQLNDVPSKLYKELAKMAVSHNPFYHRLEAFWILGQVGALDFSVQELLTQALLDKALVFRKQAYPMLSTQKYIPPLVVQKLRESVILEKHLKTKSVIDIQKDYQSLKNTEKSIQSLMVKLKDVDRLDPQLSTFLGDILKSNMSSDELSWVIALIRELKILDSHTIPPILNILPHTTVGIQREIIKTLVHTRSTWNSTIFHKISSYILRGPYALQQEMYYLLEKLLWSNPVVKEHIRTIFYNSSSDNQPIYQDFRQLLFTTKVRYRVAGLWLLSQVSHLSRLDIRHKLLDFIADTSIFKQVMAIHAIEHLPSINREIEIQQKLIDKLKTHTPSMIRTFIMVSIQQVKSMDISIKHEIFRILFSDPSENVRSRAIYVFGSVDWDSDSDSLDLKNQIIDHLVKIIKTHPIDQPIVDESLKITSKDSAVYSAIERRAALWALGELHPSTPKVHHILAKVLKDPIQEDQRLAYRALQKINPSDPVVIKQMESAYVGLKHLFLNPSPPPVQVGSSCRQAFEN